jgi:hypothetical protein
LVLLVGAADQQLLQRKRQLEMNTLSAAGGGGMAALQVGCPAADVLSHMMLS